MTIISRYVSTCTLYYVVQSVNYYLYKIKVVTTLQNREIISIEKIPYNKKKLKIKYL